MRTWSLRDKAAAGPNGEWRKRTARGSYGGTGGAPGSLSTCKAPPRGGRRTRSGLAVRYHLGDGRLSPRLALVGVKCGFDFCFSLILRDFLGLKLRIAAFADANGWQWRLHDPKFALLHDCSLAHLAGLHKTRGNQVAPLPASGNVQQSRLRPGNRVRWRNIPITHPRGTATRPSAR